MALDRSELDSLAASLTDLVNRLGTVAATADEDDEVLLELREVERQLQTSSRRLEKVVRRAGR